MHFIDHRRQLDVCMEGCVFFWVCSDILATAFSLKAHLGGIVCFAFWFFFLSSGRSRGCEVFSWCHLVWFFQSLAVLEKMKETRHNRLYFCLSQAFKMFQRKKKKKRKIEVSAPKNFEHRVHTSYDAVRGCFVGLPPQWQSIIETLKRPKPLVDPSNITSVQRKKEKVQHLEVLCLS